MATAMTQPIQLRRPSQNAVATNFSSNNPFRRRLTPSAAAQERPVFDVSNKPRIGSNNPFLDTYRSEIVTPPKPQRSTSPLKPVTNGESYPKPRRQPDLAAQLDGLTLTEKQVSSTNIQPRPSIGARPGSENRNSRDERGRWMTDVGAPSKLLDRDIFAPSPEKSENRRPRRNSESSTIDIKESERRRRERKAREQDLSKKDARPSRPRKPNHQVDLIDKLDVTGIYGPGMFHHDGPFDACNAHRNRKGLKQTPMQAFPEGSANNVLGGSGPVNKGLNLDRIHGRGAEGFSDFNDTNAVETQSAYIRRPYLVNPYTESPKTGFDQVHGEESLGLGTTTFLEGAPASRMAARRTSENEAADSAPLPPLPNGGIQRKKSIVQKLRSLSKNRLQPFGDSERMISPEAREFRAYGDALSSSPSAMDSSYGVYTTQSAGGRGRVYEENPFFVEHAKETAQVRVSTSKSGEGRKNTSPPVAPSAALTRKLTNDATAAAAAAESGEQKSLGGGLLQRVKSLRGGRRPRPEQRPSFG